MAMTKAELRVWIRSRRLRRPGSSGQASALRDAALTCGLLQPGMGLATYLAAPGEPDPAGIRSWVRENGGRVLVPVAGSNRRLGWAHDEGAYRWDDVLPVPRPTGEPVAWGAEELLRLGIDLVLAPALAVDESGGRLGQGGGFFDTLILGLTRLGPSGRGGRSVPVHVIAVVHEDEVLAAGTIPMEPHDQHVFTTLTPRGVRTLGSPSTEPW